MFDLRAFLDPRIARTLPERSPERELSSLSLRQLWHRVFDPCPSVLDLSPPDGKNLLEAFLAHAGEARHPMDWTLHLLLLDWLPSRIGSVSAALAREVLASSASRWARSDLSSAKGVFLSSPLLGSREVVGAWKTASFTGRCKVFTARLDSLEDSGGTAFAFVDGPEALGRPSWIRFRGGSHEVA